MNIGLDEGTHFDAYDAKRPSSKIGLGKMEWPLKYNDSMKVDAKQQKYDSKFFFSNRMFGIKKKLRGLFFRLL